MALATGPGSRTSGWSARFARVRARLFYGPVGLAWLRAAMLAEGGDAGRWRSAAVPTSPALVQAARLLRKVRDALRGSRPHAGPAAPQAIKIGPSASASVRPNPAGDPRIIEFIAVTTVADALFAIETWDIVSAQLPQLRVRLPEGDTAPSRALRRMLEHAASKKEAGLTVEVRRAHADETSSLTPASAAVKIITLATPA